MGCCSSVALEDAPDGIYNVLVRGYVRQLKKLYVPDSVIHMIESYIPRARWGSVYGRYGGRPFDSLHLNGFTNKITGVEIFGGNSVDSIRFQVNGKWMNKYGGNGGTKHTLILKENEYFNRVGIRSSLYVDKLKLHTTHDRTIEVGGDGGWYYEEGNDESILVDCKGRSGDLIDHLQFLWQ